MVDHATRIPLQRFNVKSEVQTANHAKYAKAKGVEWTTTFTRRENQSSLPIRSAFACFAVQLLGGQVLFSPPAWGWSAMCVARTGETHCPTLFAARLLRGTRGHGCPCSGPADVITSDRNWRID